MRTIVGVGRQSSKEAQRAPVLRIQGVHSPQEALITHSPAEFILDFARLLPGAPKARVQTRVVMAPRNVKRLMAALSDNLRKYEERYGEIPDDSESPSVKDIGFTSR